MPNKSRHPSKLSPADIDEIVRLYRENSSISACSLSTRYSCSNVVISKYLRRHIPPDEYARLKLLRNPTHPGVEAVANRRNELEKRRKERQNRVNHNRFSGQIGPAEAYWVGFLLADGCIHKNRVCLELQEQDRDHLVKFHDFMNASNAIIHVPQHKSYCFRFTSDAIVNDLARFGVIPRKSLTDSFGLNIPEPLLRHYVRGLFDGDGSLHVDSRPRVIAQVAGSYAFCSKLLHSVPTLGIGPYAAKQSLVCSVQFQSDRALDFLIWLYADSTYEIRLDRKHKRAQEFLEFFKGERQGVYNKAGGSIEIMENRYE